MLEGLVDVGAGLASLVAHPLYAAIVLLSVHHPAFMYVGKDFLKECPKHDMTCKFMPMLLFAAARLTWVLLLGGRRALRAWARSSWLVMFASPSALYALITPVDQGAGARFSLLLIGLALWFSVAFALAGRLSAPKRPPLLSYLCLVALFAGLAALAYVPPPGARLIHQGGSWLRELERIEESLIAWIVTVWGHMVLDLITPGTRRLYAWETIVWPLVAAGTVAAVVAAVVTRMDRCGADIAVDDDNDGERAGDGTTTKTKTKTKTTTTTKKKKKRPTRTSTAYSPEAMPESEPLSSGFDDGMLLDETEKARAELRAGLLLDVKYDDESSSVGTADTHDTTTTTASATTAEVEEEQEEEDEDDDGPPCPLAQAADHTVMEELMELVEAGQMDEAQDMLDAIVAGRRTRRTYSKFCKCRQCRRDVGPVFRQLRENKDEILEVMRMSVDEDVFEEEEKRTLNTKTLKDTLGRWFDHQKEHGSTEERLQAALAQRRMALEKGSEWSDHSESPWNSDDDQ